ncbi:HNH endonuclease OS=Streptomyces alboniger OX=132473 GN=CP975_12095 PE=4 SV=1 [Streptomyces alboniger]
MCLEESGAFMHSATVTVPAPSVVRLKRFVRVPDPGPVPLTRRALFARDGGRCMYCGGVATSVDHVIPRSRGGKHVWTTSSRPAVAATTSRPTAISSRSAGGCAIKPAPPTGLAWRIIGTGHRDPRWLPYLQPYGADDALARIDGISA